ncbi:MAG TPA: galactokinase [Candidatus Angelobacter sp.]|nr:galactokinase [Candidatus Angelobacter sp.]
MTRDSFPITSSNLDGERAIGLRDHFREIYGGSCQIFRAPGRINLIGEHTDYNDGFVMPAAIQFNCWTAIAPTPNRAIDDRTIEVRSSQFHSDESRTFHLDRPKPHGDWSDYVQGVAAMLESSGVRLPGAKMLIASDVPIGSGLSSSAALEVSVGLAFLSTQTAEWDRRRLALACQRAENEFVGARCGIMDQYVACHGKAGHLLMLDCRSLDHRLLRLPDEARLVICNTMVKHSNAAGEFNLRRSECEEGVHLIAKKLPSVAALRDLSPSQFEQWKSDLPPTIQKRCRHVIDENNRVVAAADALESNDAPGPKNPEQAERLKRLGMLMAASHQSLRDDYEVSSPELDLMVELANQIPGVYGARMTGGGFGGCTVNVVAAEAVPEFQDKVAAQYQAKTGIAPEIYVSAACEGAEQWPGAATKQPSGAHSSDNGSRSNDS